jgi:hypothetical protein
MAKIGVGVITCNRPDFLQGLLDTVPYSKIDEFVVVNDGKPVDVALPKGSFLQNDVNIGVGKSKNRAMKHLVNQGCDYIFIIEDDMIIKDSNIFDLYINAHVKSGIHHFNYGPGSPFNRKQTIRDFDLHNRHLLDQSSEPTPKLIVDYGDVKIALYEHTVAMFSFFTREVLEKVGYIDEDFDQCWEHVHHTYMISKFGYHPPFWWFADIANSDNYLTEAPDAINKSAIAKNKDEWMKKVMIGREIYKSKTGIYPNHAPAIPKEEVINILKQLKKSRG